MKDNPDKCHLIVSDMHLVKDWKLKLSTYEIKFENHINKMCIKSSQN